MEPIDQGPDGPETLRQVQQELERVSDQLRADDVSAAQRGVDHALDTVRDAIVNYDGKEKS